MGGLDPTNSDFSFGFQSSGSQDYFANPEQGLDLNHHFEGLDVPVPGFFMEVMKMARKRGTGILRFRSKFKADKWVPGLVGWSLESAGFAAFLGFWLGFPPR